MLDLLIKNALIITMDDARPIIENGIIGIENGKIRFVGSAEAESAGRFEALRVIDASGRIVMPGLINAHTHAAMCLMRGYADDYALNEWLFNRIFPVEARLTEAAVTAGARLGIAEMLASGTTSFSDMYFFQPAVARVVEETGIRASLCNAVIALGDDYVFEEDRAVRETERLIREFHNTAGGRIRADAAIHGEYTSSPQIWHKVSDIAGKYGLVTQLHLSETKREHEECIERSGKTPTERFCSEGVFDTKVLAAHGVWLTSHDIQLLAEKGVSVAHNPVSNLKLASGIADIAALLRAGVNVCLGTDGCASNNSHDLFEELKLAPLLAKGISSDPRSIRAYEALKLATVNGAAAQGREGTIGMLRTGFDADMIMIDTKKPHLRPIYDPCGTIVYSVRGSDVVMTMVQGKILYENGEWLTIDIERAISEAETLGMPILKGTENAADGASK